MRPRVALVASTTAEESGGELAARLNHLLGIGWDARLYCKGARWRADDALRDPALRRHIELAPHARKKSSPFDRRLRRSSPDLVHFHSGWAAWKGLQRSQLGDARVVVSFRDDGQDLALPEPGLLWERAGLLLFGHRAALERAVARGWPRDRAEILHSPVPVVAPDRRVSRDSGTLRILSAGSLIWEQGFEHSIHAVRLLLDAGVRCSYRIVGEGDHVQAVAFARHQLGLTDHVQILAPEGGERLTQELERADVFVDPAVTDTTSPAALNAARASGLPLVITRGGDPPRDGAGIAVQRRSPQALADALALLAADPELRTRMGRQGLASGWHAVGNHLTRLEHLYRAVLGLLT